MSRFKPEGDYGKGGRHAVRGLVLSMVFVAGAFFVGPVPAIAAPAATVKMSDTPPKFIPEKITIKAGQSIEWENNAQTLHSVTDNPENAVNKADASFPKGAKAFDSGFMAPGQKYTETFTVPGEYHVVCLPHEKDGMLGVITVKK